MEWVRGSSQGGMIVKTYRPGITSKMDGRRSQAILGSSGDEFWGDHDVAGSTLSATTHHDDGLIVDLIVSPYHKRVRHEEALPSEGKRSRIATERHLRSATPQHTSPCHLSSAQSAVKGALVSILQMWGVRNA